MAYSSTFIQRAGILRKQGYSYKEIADELHVAKSTIYGWTQDIVLSPEAEKILYDKTTLAQRKATEYNIRRHQTIRKAIHEKVAHDIDQVVLDEGHYRVIAGLLYWAEGEKAKGRCTFVNSDPVMIQTFLHCFRKGFKLDESKFRVMMYIHDYHNDVKQKEFWSSMTHVPLSQFSKSYVKPHTGKQIHPGYQGCISVKYFDTKIAAELKMTYNKLPEKLGV